VVCEYEDVAVLWNQGVKTDGKVLVNRPGIIIKNNRDESCLLIRGSNAIRKECNTKGH
jgi:hypothetical protein